MSEAFLSCEVVWSDPDLLEISLQVAFGVWSGGERAYVTREELARFSEALRSVELGSSSAELQAGQEDLSFIKLRVFEYSRARRLAMEVHLGRAAQPQMNFMEHGSELRLTIPVERGQFSTFAADLSSVVHAERGTARMLVPNAWP
jgi:hypothetical protein